MAKPIHPDDLDAVAAAQGGSIRSREADQRLASSDEVAACLDMLARQRFSNLPRKARTRTLVLACIALLMARYKTYSESELNDLLRSWLSTSGLTIDHVACRRHLVEHGFVRRDRAGLRYIADYAGIESLLDSDALVIARARMLEHR